MKKLLPSGEEIVIPPRGSPAPWSRRAGVRIFPWTNVEYELDPAPVVTFFWTDRDGRNLVYYYGPYSTADEVIYSSAVARRIIGDPKTGLEGGYWYNANIRWRLFDKRVF